MHEHWGKKHYPDDSICGIVSVAMGKIRNVDITRAIKASSLYVDHVKTEGWKGNSVILLE